MHIIGKKGSRCQLCQQFSAIFLLGQDVVISQISLYIELDMPFLDNHYCGYQLSGRKFGLACTFELHLDLNSGVITSVTQSHCSAYH